MLGPAVLVAHGAAGVEAVHLLRVLAEEAHGVLRRREPCGVEEAHGAILRGGGAEGAVPARAQGR